MISITPTLFTYGDELEEYYIGNYSRLHAYELILSPYLSMRLKSAAAQRMLNHPKTLQSDPLIQFTLNHMADNSIQSQILYDMIWPLGEFQTEVMRLQDHAEVVLYIRSHHIDPNVQHISQKIDWASDFSDALTEEKMHTLSNPYGIEDSNMGGVLKSEQKCCLLFQDQAIQSFYISCRWPKNGRISKSSWTFCKSWAQSR